jgi:polar amino acid transport system substrate-binding protein
MLQLTQNYKSGDLHLEEVPPPLIQPGGILVRTAFSLISSGTERTKVEIAKKGYLGKAKARPDQVRAVFHTLREQGVANTYRKVMGKLDSLTPLGYSASGIVTETAGGSGSFRIGDRVACAGGGYANHAEVNFLPVNLAAKVPEGVTLEQAAFATLGAIALQGVRRSRAELGSTVAVIGLGLLGLLTVQILRAAGCRIMGIDVNGDSVDFARKWGAECGGTPAADDLEKMGSTFSDGYGVDAVIITAGTKSNQPVVLAGKLLRERGSVVIVGDVGLKVPRDPDYYRKELQLLMSRSYGPGRYDPNYEEKGIDYPVGYARWTEKRNITAFLRLIEAAIIDIDPIISHIIPFEDAPTAYELLTSPSEKRYAILLKYKGMDRPPDTSRIQTPPPEKATVSAGSSHLTGQVRDETLEQDRPKLDEISLGCAGAGSFARSYLLPHFGKMDGVRLRSITSASGLTAKDVGNKFGFRHFPSTFEEMLGDPKINTVLIATRHNLHTPMTIEALKAGRAVFVEKPLCIDTLQLQEIKGALAAGSVRLMVGFNRRFSPYTRFLKEQFSNAAQPLTISMRINAGAISEDHWIRDADQGGGRIAGELCHFVDLMRHLVGHPVVSLNAVPTGKPKRGWWDCGNLTVTLSYRNGSTGSITYISSGSTAYPKERIEVFGEGKTGVIDDFKSAAVAGVSGLKRKKGSQDKGHREEIRVFVKALRDGDPMPIALGEIIETTETTLAVLESLRKRTRVDFRG